MAKKINLVFGINDFTMGGAQRLALDLFNYLEPETYSVTLISFFELPYRKDFYARIPSQVNVVRFGCKGFLDIRAWFRLYKILKALKPDIVVSTLFFSNTVLRILKFLLKYKIIIVEQNTYIDKKWFFIVLDNALARVTSAFVATSKTVADFTSRQELISLQKFEVIHSGVDLNAINEYRDIYTKDSARDFLKLPHDKKILLNVSRLTPQKNQTLLIDAFYEFQKTTTNCLLLIVGEGSLRAELEAKIKEYGLEENVILAGGQENVFPYYIAADFFISTSIIEGFSLVHAEAMACGLPLLSTKTAGPDVMIEEGSNGYFINRIDPHAVAEDIRKMFRSDLRAMSKASLQRVQSFSIKTTAENYKKLFNRLM
jgi:glycosyltransferase involved in cell wall biosynthesis